MNSYLIDSFRGGISEYEDKGISGAFKHAKAIDIRKKVDSISCQQALVEETGVTFDSLMKFIVPASDGHAYGFTSNGKIYKRDGSAKTWSLVYTDANGDITGAAEFYIDNNKTYLFWANATKLHAKEIPGQTDWSDVDDTITNEAADPQTFPKTNLTSSSYHTMKQVVDRLLICNSNFVAMVGVDASYTTEALNLIPKNISKAIIERNLYAVIGTERSDLKEESGLFFWDQVSATNWNDKKYLPAKSVNALIDTEIPLAQIGDDGLLYLSDGANTIPIARFPGGGEVNPDGVDVFEGLALFGVFGNGADNTGVYTYGRKGRNQPVTLNLDYPLTCDEIGSVTTVGSDVVITYRNELAYGVKRIDTTAKATGYYYSLDLKAPARMLRQLPLWSGVILTTKPMPAGTSIELFYKTDKTGNWKQANIEGGDTTFDTVGGQEAVFNLGDKGKYFEFYVKLNPSANLTPEIYKIEPLFQ